MIRKNNELTLTTPEGVLEAIGAKDFRSISKKQLLKFLFPDSKYGSENSFSMY